MQTKEIEKSPCIEKQIAISQWGSLKQVPKPMTLSLLNKILLDEIYAQELFFFSHLPAEGVVQIGLVF